MQIWPEVGMQKVTSYLIRIPKYGFFIPFKNYQLFQKNPELKPILARDLNIANY